MGQPKADNDSRYGAFTSLVTITISRSEVVVASPRTALPATKAASHAGNEYSTKARAAAVTLQVFAPYRTRHKPMRNSLMAELTAAGSSTVEVWPAPGMVTRREPWMRSWTRSALAGTVATSWSPTMMRVGTRILAISSYMPLRVMTPMVARVTPIRWFLLMRWRHTLRCAARAGSLRNFWPNMIGMTRSTTRPRQSQREMKVSCLYFGMFSAGSGSEEVSKRTSDLTRSGLRAARRMAMKPPMERPTKWQGAQSRASMRAAASS